MGRLGAVAIAAGCGVLGACLYLSVLLGSPGALILMYLAQLPLFVAGLWFGSGAAAIAGLSAFVVMFAATDMIAALLFAALNVGPVVLLVRQALLARRGPAGQIAWYPPGLLVAWLTGLALAGLVAALVGLGGPAELKAMLSAVVAHSLDRLAEYSLPDRDQVAAVLATIIPGVVAASWMIMAIVNGRLAQGLLARFGANWRPSPDLAGLSLPVWLAGLFGIAVAATLLGGIARYLGINTMIALFVPFCLAGLAVLHAAARRLSHPAMALTIFYVVAGLFGWPLLVAALLGLFENWLGLRRRLMPPGG